MAHDLQLAVFSFIYARGEPGSTIEFLRQTPIHDLIPGVAAFSVLTKALHYLLEDALFDHCRTATFANLAIDGWSDLRGRRYQGVTARLIDGGENTTILLLVLKEIKAVHDSARELQLLVNATKERFALGPKLLNICTDRCAMNVSAFREEMTSGHLSTGHFWLPCACHILNNLLAHFFDHIPEVVKPIFRIQQRFRKHGPFLAFLAARDSPVQAIPSYSTVRWCSSHSLFTALLRLWDLMIEFADRERWHIAELTQGVHEHLVLLHDLTRVVHEAQVTLESDLFGTGSQFIGALLSVRHHIHKFGEIHPVAVQAFDDELVRFKGEYGQEYCVFLLMTFLDPSTQFVVGRTCTEEEFVRMLDLLERLVRQDIDSRVAGDGVEDVEPASDDFRTFFSLPIGNALDAGAQIRAYCELRRIRPHPRDYWRTCGPELTNLASIARRFLGALTTSASVERSFSLARAVCADFRLAMKPETITARVLIRANWTIARPLLVRVLEMSPEARVEIVRAREHSGRTAWREAVFQDADG
jgi:hypothetical protein